MGIAYSLVFFGTTIPCIFVKRKSLDDSDYMDIGFYSYKIDGTCYSLGEDYSPDSYLSAARIFSALSIVFGGIAAIAAGVSFCFEPNANERRYMGYVFIISSVTNAISLLI